MKKLLTIHWQDLRYIRLVHRRYKTTHYGDADYWHKVALDYNRFKKRVDNTDYRWYVITYKDGSKELMYFKVWRIVIPHGGRLCRGAIIPRYFGVTDYEHVKEIRLAF